MRGLQIWRRNTAGPKQIPSLGVTEVRTSGPRVGNFPHHHQEGEEPCMSIWFCDCYTFIYCFNFPKWGRPKAQRGEVRNGDNKEEKKLHSLAGGFLFGLVLFLLETGSHIDQTGLQLAMELRLALDSWPSCLCLQRHAPPCTLCAESWA